MNVIKIAKVCHQTNRAYCQTIGDFSQPEWDLAPEWQKKSAIEGVTAHLAILEGGEVPAPSLSHDLWLEHKAREGWKWGPIKNPDTKEHPDFLPYDKLPLVSRMKDYLFGAIIGAFYDADKTPDAH